MNTEVRYRHLEVLGLSARSRGGAVGRLLGRAVVFNAGGHIGAIGSLSTAVESTLNKYLQRIESRRLRVA